MPQDDGLDFEPELWREALDVGLTAMFEHKLEQAEAIWDRLDLICPNWQFKVLHDLSDALIKKRITRSKAVVIWMLKQTTTHKVLAQALGCSIERIRQLADRGDRELWERSKCTFFDVLEDDFQSAHDRQIIRRRELGIPANWRTQR